MVKLVSMKETLDSLKKAQAFATENNLGLIKNEANINSGEVRNNIMN